MKYRQVNVVTIMESIEKVEIRLGPGRESRRRVPRLSLVFLPVLLVLFGLVYGIIDTNERAATFSLVNFWEANWQFGLTAAQTMWNPMLFWGELWFNLFVALLLAGLWIYKAPPQRDDSWKPSKKATKVIFLSSLGIVVGLAVAMGITMVHATVTLGWETPDLLVNWYPTHMAYQLPVFPGLVAGALLLVAPMTRNKQESGKRPFLSITLLLCAVGIWLVMSIPTDWDPHALTNLELQLFTWLCTFALPMCGFVFVAGFTLRKPPRRGDGMKGRAWLHGLLTLGGVGIFLVIMVITAFHVPQIGAQEMWGIWVHWWWPFAHWPNYVFTGAVALALVSGTRLWHGLDVRARIIDALPRIKHQRKVKAILTASAVAVMCLVPVVGIVARESDPPRLLVNQVGYLPSGMKNVFFQAPKGIEVPGSATFTVHDAVTGHVVHEGTLHRYGNKSYYQHWYMNGSFDAFTTPGRYYLAAEVGGMHVKSHEFSISGGAYDLTRERAVQFFYYQRCGYEVEEIVEGYHYHHACHLDDALMFSGSPEFNFSYPHNTREHAVQGELVYKNLTGGWHDAGDYNKYNSWYQTQWFCTHALNTAWEMDKDYYESLDVLYDSVAPDILDEALWGANFMHKCRVTAEDVANGLKPWTEGLLVENVIGWNWANNQSALMGYSGRPHLDAQRVGGSNRAPGYDYETRMPWGFAGAGMAFGFAGTLLATARLVDEYAASNPEYELPSWSVDTSELVATAYALNDTYGEASFWEKSGNAVLRLNFLKEHALRTGEPADWAAADAYAESEVLYSIWVPSDSWMDAYKLAQLLEYYVRNNRTMPANVSNTATTFQNNVFTNNYLGPFKVLHALNTPDGEPRLFGRSYLNGRWDHHGLHNTDMLSLAYLQAVISEVNPAIEKMELVQHELDFLFGVNPLALCQMDAVGGTHVEQIHHRYAYAGYPSGRVPGGIINGIRNIQPTVDWARLHGIEEWVWENRNISDTEIMGSVMDHRWWLVEEEAWVDAWHPCPVVKDGTSYMSNEIWIPHNALYLHLIATLNYYHF